MIKLAGIGILMVYSVMVWSQPFLSSPIQGVQGKDWIIVNYVDWEFDGFVDHNCGSKSYDGHQGTDYTLPSFKSMDEEVGVYAAASGRVTFTIDGEFDRETEGDVSKGLGNYIGIKHPNLYYTYYGHLKNGSIAVNVGDSVEAGQLIGYVGSSGNSTDPHLHFEVWYDSTFVVDPFVGDCGNATGLFIDPPVYDTSVTVWESGLLLKNDLGINDLRERVEGIERPYEINHTSPESLNYWAHLYGVRAGKELKLNWYTPDNTEWFEFSFILDRDYWYYYYWSFINNQDLDTGEWTVDLSYDNEIISSENFLVREVTSVDTPPQSSKCDQYMDQPLSVLLKNEEINLRLYDLNGRMVTNVVPIPNPGLYLFQINEKHQTCAFKRYLR